MYLIIYMCVCVCECMRVCDDYVLSQTHISLHNDYLKCIYSILNFSLVEWKNSNFLVDYFMFVYGVLKYYFSMVGCLLQMPYINNIMREKERQRD